MRRWRSSSKSGCFPSLVSLSHYNYDSIEEFIVFLLHVPDVLGLSTSSWRNVVRDWTTYIIKDSAPLDADAQRVPFRRPIDWSTAELKAWVTHIYASYNGSLSKNRRLKFCGQGVRDSLPELKVIVAPSNVAGGELTKQVGPQPVMRRGLLKPKPAKESKGFGTKPTAAGQGESARISSDESEAEESGPETCDDDDEDDERPLHIEPKHLRKLRGAKVITTLSTLPDEGSSIVSDDSEDYRPVKTKTKIVHAAHPKAPRTIAAPHPSVALVGISKPPPFPRQGVVEVAIPSRPKPALRVTPASDAHKSHIASNLSSSEGDSVIHPPVHDQQQDIELDPLAGEPLQAWTEANMTGAQPSSAITTAVIADAAGGGVGLDNEFGAESARSQPDSDDGCGPTSKSPVSRGSFDLFPRALSIPLAQSTTDHSLLSNQYPPGQEAPIDRTQVPPIGVAEGAKIRAVHPRKLWPKERFRMWALNAPSFLDNPDENIYRRTYDGRAVSLSSQFS